MDTITINRISSFSPSRQSYTEPAFPSFIRHTIRVTSVRYCEMLVVLAFRWTKPAALHHVTPSVNYFSEQIRSLSLLRFDIVSALLHIIVHYRQRSLKTSQCTVLAGLPFARTPRWQESCFYDKVVQATSRYTIISELVEAHLHGSLHTDISADRNRRFPRVLAPLKIGVCSLRLQFPSAIAHIVSSTIDAAVHQSIEIRNRSDQIAQSRNRLGPLARHRLP